MSLHICVGPEKTDGGYRCGCCGGVAKSADSFAMSACWPCSFGENGFCPNCVRLGVPFHEFQRGRVMHGLRSAPVMGDPWVAKCGYVVPWLKVGQGTAVVHRYCQRCWPEEGLAA